MNIYIRTVLVPLAGILLVSSVQAQEGEGKRYITPPEYAENVYFGDAHIHTRISVDSSLWGNTLGPADTYKYVRGGEVTSFKGWTVKLGRPLDWTIISDHSDVWGFFQLMEDGAPIVMAEPKGVRWHDMIMNKKTIIVPMPTTQGTNLCSATAFGFVYFYPFRFCFIALPCKLG